jgi:hypothetical protein
MTTIDKCGADHEESHEAAAPINFKNPKIQPPEIMGSVRLSSREPSSTKKGQYHYAIKKGKKLPT